MTRRSTSEFARGLLLGLLGLGLCATAAEASDHGQDRPQIRVVGHAEVAAAPDRVSLDVAVVTRAATASEAAADNAEATSAVFAKLKKAFPNAAELATRGYSLHAEYDYDKLKGKRTPAGFSARNTIHASLDDVTRAGPLIDAAVAAGANEVQSIRFSVAEPAPFVSQALAAAAADARARAAALAEGMGVKVGRIIRVEEVGAGQPQAGLMAFAESARAQTPIAPGDVFFSADVALWVELVEK